MKVEDFEKAIDALGCGIVIDEIVIGKGGEVKVAYGHSTYLWNMWDSFGRCFACPSEEKIPLEVAAERPEIHGFEWERSKGFDLEFK